MSFSPDQVAAARRMNDEYQRRCDMLWDDMLFELQMRFGLDDEQADELLREHL